MTRRVLIVPTWYPTRRAPTIGLFVRQQAQALAAALDVAVLVPDVIDLGRILHADLGGGPAVERDGAVTVARERVVAPIPNTPATRQWAFSRAVRRGFRRLTRRWGRPDVIHAHVVLPGGRAALELRRATGIPLVLTEHSSPFSIQLRTAHQRRLVREVLAGADRLVAVSPALAEQIRAFERRAEVEVVGNVIDTEFFTPAPGGGERPPGPTRFLALGLLTEQKGIVHLIDAVRRLVGRGVTDLEVVIGGDGPERRRLEAAARDRGIERWCRFVGLLSPEAVRDWMRWADTFVLPSLHETFGVVLGEAMACGTPVIATRCGGPDSVVTPAAGVLVEVGDPEALAAAMERVVTGEPAYEAAAIRQAVIDRFGPEAFRRRIMATYDALAPA